MEKQVKRRNFQISLKTVTFKFNSKCKKSWKFEHRRGCKNTFTSLILLKFIRTNRKITLDSQKPCFKFSWWQKWEKWKIFIVR